MNYTHHIKRNADGKPKTLSELMEGAGIYNPKRANDAAEDLAKRGIIKRTKEGTWLKR